MNRKLFAIGVAIVAIGVIGGAIAFAANDGWDRDREVEYRVVNPDGGAAGEGTLLVLDDDRRGPPGFFPIFPFVIIGGVVIAIAVFGGGRRRWNGQHGDFDNWHREAHWNWGSAGPKDAPPADPPASA